MAGISSPGRPLWSARWRNASQGVAQFSGRRARPSVARSTRASKSATGTSSTRRSGSQSGPGNASRAFHCDSRRSSAGSSAGVTRHVASTRRSIPSSNVAQLYTMLTNS